MKKLFCLLLTFCMLLSVFAAAGVQAAAGTEKVPEQIAGGAILHCFNWSYDSIRENLAEIAAAGYTAVQTSPVQQPKDYNANYTDASAQWWKLYQPLGLSIAPSGTTWLGSADDLRLLCDEAEEYGIKVIVDIVANHLANNGQSGGGYDNLSVFVESNLRNVDYYHTDLGGVSDNSRYDMTQKHLGMPDLNTGNDYIQQRVLDLLKACVDLGVDGFRFDAAKHIELPSDPVDVRSDFWPTVIDGIKSYKSDVYCYGEILYNAGTDITNYTNYIAVTDSVSSAEARSGAANANAGQLADGRYQMGEAPADAVLWVESHDTYEDGSTSGISDDKIVKAWAIVGARAESTSLYLARPNAVMGLASSDTTWSSAAVSEVNKFKNHFAGYSEYLSYSQDAAITCIERGGSGIVISCLNGGGKVYMPVHQMGDGTYTDQVSGSTFTVSGGVITGYVGNSGVAVVYNKDEQPVEAQTASNAYYLFGNINGADYGCENDWENLGDYKFVNGKLTATFTQDSYVGVKAGDNAHWYMTDGWLGTETTEATLYNTQNLGNDANRLYVPGGVKLTFTLTPGENDTFTLSYAETPIDYYLFGNINGADYGCESDWENLGVYKFVDGKLTATFTQDSYVGVKAEDNGHWYMTDAWLGTGTAEATLYNTQNLGNDANKLYVPGGVKLTFTLTPGENDTFTLSYAEAPIDYYLFGNINGADYGCESDWENLGVYKFVEGKLTATFTCDSYVGVKAEDNGHWYMTDAWLGTGTTEATLYNTQNLGNDANKLYVPGGVKLTFTLTPGENDTFILSYAEAAELVGDINDDGGLSIEDVTALLNILASGDLQPKADVDGSGSVTIEDVTALLNILANG